MSDLKEQLEGFEPKTALVLGSGLGGVVDALDVVKRIPYGALDAFPESGVSGHTGELVLGRLGANDVAVLSGRVHYYEEGRADAMRGPLEALKSVGVERLVLTNSAGSLVDEMQPGSVMQITDHVNFSGTNPLIGEASDARFVGMTSAYSASLQIRFQHAAEACSVHMHRGVYMWFSGPSFETPAEIRMAKTFGADAVGMSTVPEVILARFLGLDVAAFSVITNMGAGITGSELSHMETKEMAPIGGKRLTEILNKAFEETF